MFLFRRKLPFKESISFLTKQTLFFQLLSIFQIHIIDYRRRRADFIYIFYLHIPTRKYLGALNFEF